MTIWVLKQLKIPVYSVGAKIGFGEMGEFNPDAKYLCMKQTNLIVIFFFKPHISIISGIDYDHPDIYPTRDEYYQSIQGIYKPIFYHLYLERRCNKTKY